MERFIKEFAEVLDIEDVSILNKETSFTDLDEWSSFAAVQLIVLYDEKYHKDITAIDIRKCNTIGELFELTK